RGAGENPESHLFEESDELLDIADDQLDVVDPTDHVTASQRKVVCPTRLLRKKRSCSPPVPRTHRARCGRTSRAARTITCSPSRRRPPDRRHFGTAPAFELRSATWTQISGSRIWTANCQHRIAPSYERIHARPDAVPRPLEERAATHSARL